MVDNSHGYMQGGRFESNQEMQNYQINQDENPELITKKSDLRLDYTQEIAVRYLRPPTPPEPGDIIIQEMPNQMPPPAPPLIIRQLPPRCKTPEPMGKIFFKFFWN